MITMLSRENRCRKDGICQDLNADFVEKAARRLTKMVWS